MDNRVAYFAGCFANFVAPEIGRAVVEVLHQNGIAVTFPDQRCCGIPWLSQGVVGEARQRAAANTRWLSRTGGDIVTACTTCALALKREYPAWLGTAEAVDIAARTYDVFEYLARRRAQGRLKNASQPGAGSVLYHAPCHLKVWGPGPIEERLALLNAIPGLSVRQIDRGCCGLAGTWGSKRQNYSMSMRIGVPLFEEIERQKPDKVATDCPTCQMQLEHGTGREVVHPIVLVAQAYGWKTSPPAASRGNRPFRLAAAPTTDENGGGFSGNMRLLRFARNDGSLVSLRGAKPRSNHKGCQR